MEKGKYIRWMKPAEETLEQYLIRMAVLHKLLHDILFGRRESAIVTPILGYKDHRTEDEISTIFRALNWADHLGRWKAGDELIYLRKVMGANKSYRLCATAMGRSERWSLELRRVSEAFPLEQRYYGVPWHLYRICASTPEPSIALMFCMRSGISAKRMTSHLQSLRVRKAG